MKMCFYQASNAFQKLLLLNIPETTSGWWNTCIQQIRGAVHLSLYTCSNPKGRFSLPLRQSGLMAERCPPPAAAEAQERCRSSLFAWVTSTGNAKEQSSPPGGCPQFQHPFFTPACQGHRSWAASSRTRPLGYRMFSDMGIHSFPHKSSRVIGLAADMSLMSPCEKQFLLPL